MKKLIALLCLAGLAGCSQMALRPGLAEWSSPTKDIGALAADSGMCMDLAKVGYSPGDSGVAHLTTMAGNLHAAGRSPYTSTYIDCMVRNGWTYSVQPEQAPTRVAARLNKAQQQSEQVQR